MKTFEPQFGTIYLAVNRDSGKAEPFRYLGWCGYMRRPYDRFGGNHCGVWVMRNNEAGQTDTIEPLTEKWLKRQVKGLQRQIANRANRLDIYNNLATLVS
jgi:hypothetical protein